MALTRSMLKAMSIEDEKIDQIIEQHVQTVSEIKEERDKFKAEADELTAAKQRIAELEQADTGEDLQAKYEELEQEFNTYKTSVENEKARSQREGLYRDLLKDSGVDEKRINSILKVTDIDGLEINKDGSLKNVESLKSHIAEEWADFIATTATRGADTDTPPASSAGGMTYEQILAIEDIGERQEAIAQNHELFGF